MQVILKSWAFDKCYLKNKQKPWPKHGHDMISIRILKICDESIFIPPGILFWSCSQNGKLSSECIKVSMVPVSISPLFYCLFQAKHWKGCCMAVCLNFSLRIV